MRAASGKVGQVKHHEHLVASFVLIIIKLFIVTIVTIVVIVTIVIVKDPGSRVAPSVPGTVLARSLNNKFSKLKMFCMLQ